MHARRLAVVSLILILALPAGLAAQRRIRPGGPMRVVLLVDSSVAVRPLITSFRAGLQGFLEDLPGEPEIAIVTTGGNLRVRAAPTIDREILGDAIDKFAADGGANTFFRTLLEADERFFQTAPERRSVLVILATELGLAPGRQQVPPEFQQFLDDFVARGGRAHAVIVAGPSYGNGLLAKVAEHLAWNTGGFFETVLTGSAIPKLMRTVALYVAADQ